MCSTTASSSEFNSFHVNDSNRDVQSYNSIQQLNSQAVFQMCKGEFGEATVYLRSALSQNLLYMNDCRFRYCNISGAGREQQQQQNSNMPNCSISELRDFGTDGTAASRRSSSCSSSSSCRMETVQTMSRHRVLYTASGGEPESSMFCLDYDNKFALYDRAFIILANQNNNDDNVGGGGAQEGYWCPPNEADDIMSPRLPLTCCGRLPDRYVLAVILYNTGLAYHLKGAAVTGQSSQPETLRSALEFYQLALDSLNTPLDLLDPQQLQQVRHEDLVHIEGAGGVIQTPSRCLPLLLSVLNNIGSIIAHFQVEDETQRCLKLIAAVLEQAVPYMTNDEMYLGSSFIHFMMNVILLKDRPLHPLAAAA